MVCLSHLSSMRLNFSLLYAGFDAPIAALDCGERCGPHNERGVPFCCDIRHAVPTAYLEEWEYLQAHTDLWRLWQGEDLADDEKLRQQTPAGQILIQCLGHRQCQRDYRALTCRAFPFFPYLDLRGNFLGLSYYWEYEERCWILSHLQVVTSNYIEQFIAAFEQVFACFPVERANFRHHSIVMRRIYGRRRRAIPLLHRNGNFYKVTPRNGRLRRCPLERLPQFGPYALAADLPFPDEQGGHDG